MKSILMGLLVGVLAAGSAFGDYQNLVSVNFEHSDEVMTGAAGAGASGDVWNNLPNNTNGRYENLLDSDNNATAISYWKSTTGSGQCNGSTTAANNLFNGYTRGDTPYSTDFSAGKFLSLQGLDSGKTYDIYLYSGYDWGTATTAFKVGSDVKQPLNTSQRVDSFVENENYVVFSGISPDASGEILVYYSNGDAPFNGFQLGVPIPYADAKLVNVNFEQYDEVMTGAAGIGADGDVWNSIPANAIGFYSNLVDYVGSPTLVGMRKSASLAGACQYPANASTLFIGYNNANNYPVEDWHALDLWGLDPQKTYDLYLYSGYDWGTNSELFRVGGVEKQPDQDNTEVDSYMENKNYVVYRGLRPGANGDLRVEYKNYDAPFNGLQIATSPPRGSLFIIE